MDKLTSMAVFVKAVESGSFAAAAEALDLSAPMVGKHVRQLENALGVTLLNRSTRRQSLTDVGRHYYERCKIVLAEVATADAIAQESRLLAQGHLRISASINYGTHCLAPVLAGYAPPALPVHLLTAPGRLRTQKLQSFVDYVVDVLG